MARRAPQPAPAIPPGTPSGPPPASGEAPPTRLVRGLLAALVIATPLAIWPSAQEAFRLPKLLVLSVLAPLLLAALALTRGGAPITLHSVFGTRSARIALPLAVLGLVSLWTSSHPAHVAQTLPSFLLGLALLWGASVALRAETLEQSLAWLAVPTVLLALLGFGQATGWFQPFRFSDLHMTRRLEVTSLAGNPGDLACLVLLPALFAQWRAYTCWREQRRLALGWIAVAGVTIATVGITQTLSVVAALAAGTWVLWLCLLPTRRFLFACALALASLLAVLAATPGMRERLIQKAAQVGAGDFNEVLTGRLDGWRAASWMLEQHPLSGVGVGAFGPAYSPARLALLDRGVRFYERHVFASFDSAHSEPLHVAAELGWPGLAALAWAALLVAGAVRRTHRRDPSRGALAIAGTTALALLSLAWFPFGIVLSALPALLFLAWILALAGEAAPNAETTAAPAARGHDPAARAGLSRGLPAWLLVPVCLATAVGLGKLQLDRLRASVILSRVELASHAVIQRGEAPRNFFEVNLAALERAAQLDPANVAVPLSRGSQYLISGRPAAAIAAYRDALALDPRPEVYLNLGRALALDGQGKAAEEAVLTAMRLSPLLTKTATEILGSLKTAQPPAP
jgi:O-antigen ligase